MSAVLKYRVFLIYKNDAHGNFNPNKPLDMFKLKRNDGSTLGDPTATRLAELRRGGDLLVGT
jgi:hypothetical protein